MTSLKTIAHIHCDFSTKFGVPRQSNVINSLKATVVFTPEYANNDALRGLEGFSHIWLIWGFSEAERDTWSPTVRPPRLGGNTRMGVFATRAPYRPNPVALSAVELEHIEYDTPNGPVLHIRGADLMNGTPIYDIKPYIPYTDCIAGAKGGFAEDAPKALLKVTIDEKKLQQIPEKSRESLKEVLSHDPRPRYQNDPERTYGMEFAGCEVKFKVDGEELTVTEILKAKQTPKTQSL